MGENDGQVAGLPMTLKAGWWAEGQGSQDSAEQGEVELVRRAKARGWSRKERGGGQCGQAARGAQERLPSRGRDGDCPW